MIKTISHMGIGEAERLLNTLPPEKRNKIILISVREPKSTQQFPYDKLINGHYLTLRFDDADQQNTFQLYDYEAGGFTVEPFELFNKSHANFIKNFIDIFHNDSNEYDFIVHCHAGISRSTAIAKAVGDYVGINYLPTYELHNKLVYRILSEVFDEYEG